MRFRVFETMTDAGKSSRRDFGASGFGRDRYQEYLRAQEEAAERSSEKKLSDLVPRRQEEAEKRRAEITEAFKERPSTD